jgi:hypothetical protein
MKNDPALMYAGLSQYDSWEEQDEKSYKINDLREEYRSRLYSEEGLRMIREAGPPEGDRTDGTGQ